jgi:hypothetical protein
MAMHRVDLHDVALPCTDVAIASSGSFTCTGVHLWFIVHQQGAGSSYATGGGVAISTRLARTDIASGSGTIEDTIAVLPRLPHVAPVVIMQQHQALPAPRAVAAAGAMSMKLRNCCVLSNTPCLAACSSSSQTCRTEPYQSVMLALGMC